MSRRFQKQVSQISLLIAITLSSPALLQGQIFVDIEWNETDTVIPTFSKTYNLPEDYNSFDYALTIEYPEYEPLPIADISRYHISTDGLTESFRTSATVRRSRRQGILDVSVFPLAVRDGKIVRLTNFKPVITRTHRTGDLRRTQSPVPTTGSSVLSTGRWVKIAVSRPGVYQLTKARLASYGFSDPSKVRLYGYGREVLPETDLQKLDDDLTEIPLWRRPDGTLLFYGRGTTKWSLKPLTSQPHAFTHLNNPYSTYICYFLTEAEDAPAEFRKEATLSGGTEATTFPDHQLIEKDKFSYIHSGRTFFDDYDFGGKSSVAYTFDLPGLADPRVLLDIRFSAASASSSSLSVTANGKSVGHLSFGSLGEYIYGIVKSGTYTITNAHESHDTVRLAHTGQSGAAGHLDYIRVSYTRKLELNDSHLLFRPSAAGTLSYSVSGATDDTHVWRVTSASHTSEIPGTLADGTFRASASSDNWRDEEFVAVKVNSTFPEPTFMGTAENQNLHGLNDIDLVIIVPSNGILTTQAQRLADAHADHDSMKCIVVTADKVYNEFSSGTPDATAYRRFMKMLYDRGQGEKVLNLCLFGDGVWDNKMQTTTMNGKSQDDYLLCYESDNSISHTDSYVLEDYFALLDDEDGKKPAGDDPDCGVGRIPVKTERQAREVVDKLIPYIYNNEVGSWRNTVCLLADDGNENIHMQDAEAISRQTEELNPDCRIRKIYWDSYTRQQSATGNSYPEAYNDINDQMNEGALIMNYTGHGAAYCLSHEQVLRRSDFENWSSPRLPFWIHAACDVSPFDMDEENIGETALLNPKGGAVGVLSTTRTVYSTENRKINLEFMRYALAASADGKCNTLGEALCKAKSHYTINNYRDSINRAHFVLIGDPAIRLAHPYYKVEVDQFSGKAPTRGNAGTVIGAGAVVTVKGHISRNGSKAKDFNGIISPMVFDSKVLITCKNNSKDANTPYTFLSQDKKLFSGSDSIRNGEFSFSFTVPVDISYSDSSALISLYAHSSDRQSEANGKFTDFHLKGTDPSISADSIGPVINLTLHDESFTNSTDSSRFVNTYAFKPKPSEFRLSADIADQSGINTTGSGIGHDLTITIDNDPNLTFVANHAFNYAVGSHTQGCLYYQMPELPAGPHTLMIRAWDVLNNPASVSVEFEVIEGYDHITIFDTMGRELWSGKGTGYADTLPKGVYILRSGLETKKILIK